METEHTPSPFTASFSPSFPRLLYSLRCTIALSTYQAGKVIFLSAVSPDKLIQLPRNFSRPMGIAVDDDRMAIALGKEVVTLRNNPELGKFYPKQPGVYDAFWVPRSLLYTGYLDIHDLEWGYDGLYAVNTSFSCIVKINESNNFTPVWQPPFISALAHEDRCHLNGMAMQNGVPRYVTTFNTGDTPRSWKQSPLDSGVLVDIVQNKIVLEGLGMPHSPRVFGNKLLLLQSSTGELGVVDLSNKHFRPICRIEGFVRGLSCIGEYAFVGLSKLRDTATAAFRELPIAQHATYSGVVAIHLPTGKIIAELRYASSVEEIYDVRVLPGMQRPGIMGIDKEDHYKAIMLPGITFWAREDLNEENKV